METEGLWVNLSPTPRLLLRTQWPGCLSLAVSLEQLSLLQLGQHQLEAFGGWGDGAQALLHVRHRPEISSVL